MTEPDNHCCAACGRPKPVEFKQPVAYHVSFIAPAGIFRHVIIAHSPQEALEKAQKLAKTPDLKPEDFDPVAESFCVREITVEHPDGNEQAVWTEPDYFAEKHGNEILDYLQTIIDAADGLTEKRRELDETISEITDCAEDAARGIDALRLWEGGAA
jgi:hypothetical protein